MISRRPRRPTLSGLVEAPGAQNSILVDVGRIGEIRIRPQAIAPRVHDIGGTVKGEIQRLGYVSTIAVIGAPGGWRPARQSHYILRSITGWRFRFIIVTTRFSAVG